MHLGICNADQGIGLYNRNPRMCTWCTSSTTHDPMHYPAGFGFNHLRSSRDSLPPIIARGHTNYAILSGKDLWISNFLHHLAFPPRFLAPNSGTAAVFCGRRLGGPPLKINEKYTEWSHLWSCTVNTGRVILFEQIKVIKQLGQNEGGGGCGRIVMALTCKYFFASQCTGGSELCVCCMAVCHKCKHPLSDYSVHKSPTHLARL